jgi:hypothetical protein
MEGDEITLGINIPKELQKIIRYKPTTYYILFYKIEKHIVAL